MATYPFRVNRISTHKEATKVALSSGAVVVADVSTLEVELVHAADPPEFGTQVRRFNTPEAIAEAQAKYGPEGFEAGGYIINLEM
jgi:hypothetical protein